jgi:hypothetical protein
MEDLSKWIAVNERGVSKAHPSGKFVLYQGSWKPFDRPRIRTPKLPGHPTWPMSGMIDEARLSTVPITEASIFSPSKNVVYPTLSSKSGKLLCKLK